MLPSGSRGGEILNNSIYLKHFTNLFFSICNLFFNLLQILILSICNLFFNLLQILILSLVDLDIDGFGAASPNNIVLLSLICHMPYPS